MQTIGRQSKRSGPSPRIAESGASARILGRVSGRTAVCPRCNDTGSVWVVCPDAGAVRLPCGCGHGKPDHHVGLIDVGLATAFVACCGAAYLLF